VIIKPRIRNNICLTAHPDGCARLVSAQIDYATSRGPIGGPASVLVVGSSTGYGLASRIIAAFACGAKTVGVALEKPGSPQRAGSAGWYNAAYFDRRATAAGAWSINGDAFSDATKEETVALIKRHIGKIDLVVYSLASPVRPDPRSGALYRSVLKPVGDRATVKTVDFMSGEVSEVGLEPATQDEIESTIQVMGGEDWDLWIHALDAGAVLSPRAVTVAFSYVGPELTFPFYRGATIGKAKEHLEATARRLRDRLAHTGGSAYVSVNKAVVTKAGAVIQGFPLYASILYRVMRERGIHEGPIEQMFRLFGERLFERGGVPLDAEGRIRLDDLEMRDDVQEQVRRRWHEATTDNLSEIADLAGFRQEFLNLSGFAVEGIDYEVDVDPAGW